MQMYTGRDAQVDRSTDRQTGSYAGIWVYRGSGVQPADVRLYGGSSDIQVFACMWICGYVGIQMHRHVEIQVCRYSAAKVYK